MSLRTVVVEDEPLARRALVELVRGDARLELVGEAADGPSALALIHEMDPDLVFLDIHLPEMSGLQVLESVDGSPAIVFTTAYDEHAVTAFELGAVDYLLKPFGQERFDQAVERVVEARGRAVDPELLAELIRGEAPLVRLFARQGTRVVPIRVDSVVRFAGSGDYVEAWVAGRSFLISVRLAELEARLDPDRFIRVHRSHIVNLDQIEEIRTEDERRLRILCRGGDVVVASRDGSTRLRALMR